MHERQSGVWVAVLYALAAGSCGVITGAALPSKWLWPFVMTIAIYPLFLSGARSGKLGRTVALMLLWALASSITFIVLVRVRGMEVTAGVINAHAYAGEMLHWIRTGVGPEGSPSEFLPIHARHYALFLVTSSATAGFAGLFFGSVLLNYMNAYVATLAASATSPSLAHAIGWPPWAILRVVGYVAAGTALAHLGLCRVLGRGTWRPRAFARWMLVSAVLVVLDVVLKATLAESWRALLGRALD